MYRCPAEYVYVGDGVPIGQAIREERMRLDDIEWDTGVRPSEGWLKYLIGERDRGMSIHATGLKKVRNVAYDKWMEKYGQSK